MAIDPTIYARNLEVRLTALQGEFQKVRTRLQVSERRIIDLEEDVAELLEPAVEDERARVANVVPVLAEPKRYALKRRFQGKFAVVDTATGETVTPDSAKHEAEDACERLNAQEEREDAGENEAAS